MVLLHWNADADHMEGEIPVAREAAIAGEHDVPKAGQPRHCGGLGPHLLCEPPDLSTALHRNLLIDVGGRQKAATSSQLLSISSSSHAL